MGKRIKIPKPLRYFIYDRDGNRCLSCGSTEELTIDHIVPVAAGGQSNPSNLQTLCFDCNHKKGCKNDIRLDVRMNKTRQVQNAIDKQYKTKGKSRIKKFKY